MECADSERKISKKATTHRFKFLESKMNANISFTIKLVMVLPLEVDTPSIFMTIATQTLVPIPTLAIPTSHQLVSFTAQKVPRLFSLVSTNSKCKTSKFTKSNSEEKK